MIKILNKISNMVFIMEDERAIKLYKTDKDTFEILDGGYVEPEEPREPTVQDLVMKKEETEEEKEKKKEEEKPNIDNYSRPELIGLIMRLDSKYKFGTLKVKNMKKLKEIAKGYIEKDNK